MAKDADSGGDAGAAAWRRLGLVEARQEILLLAGSYARAADIRDLDALVALYVTDVDCGRFGRGPTALQRQFAGVLELFYRSLHLVCGQVIDKIDGDLAAGTTYCLAEQEMGPAWISIALMYDDHYSRRDGKWFFSSRKPQLFSVGPIPEPQHDLRGMWPQMPFKISLPASAPSWSKFWSTRSKLVPTLTNSP